MADHFIGEGFCFCNVVPPRVRIQAVLPHESGATLSQLRTFEALLACAGALGDDRSRDRSWPCR